MKYQNFKSDFTSVHRFYVTDNGLKTQLKVPQHVRLTFFTEQRCGCITVERNGAQTSGCTLSKDGMSLTASVPLSRTFLGEGELFCEVAQIESDSSFPQSERTEVTPLRPGITLYAGKTDEGADIEMDALLGVIVPGAIRYDAAQSLTDAQKAQACANIGALCTIPDASVSTRKIANGAVIEKKIADGAVTKQKLSDNIAGIVDSVAKGAADYSLQQNSCHVISRNSIATGNGTIAGTKGVRWKAINFTTNTITLEKALTASIGAGALLSIINDKHYDKCSEVAETAAIGATTIKVKSLPFTSIAEDTGDDAKTIMVYSNPNVGDIELGDGAHSEGVNTKATQRGSHAEGMDTYAAGQYSHAEGRETEAFYASHAEGRGSKATGDVSHAEGLGTYAIGDHTHAEGQNTHAVGLNAHAEGLRGWANGQHSHAEGVDTVTSNTAEHAEGKFNKSNKADGSFGSADNTLHSIGIGTSASDRKNATEVMQNGDAYLLGVGGYDGKNHAASKTLQQVLGAVPMDDEIVTKNQITNLASKDYVKGAITKATQEWQSSDPSRADIDRCILRLDAPDDRALPLLCGQPPILFGAGTPKESVVPDNWRQFDQETGEGYNWTGLPSAIGQQYINTEASSGGRYIGVRDGMTALKWLNC